MSVPYTDNEASEARQWSNRYGPPNAWTASLGTAARMIGRLLDERERLMAKQTVAAPGDDYIREWHEEFQRWKAVAEEKQDFRDHFAAAALTGLLSNVQRYQNEPLTRQAFEIADFMLRERERTSVGVAGMDPATDRKSAATHRACASPCSQPFDSAPITLDAYRRFVDEVMNWISEATGFLHDDVLRTDDARDIITDACSRCWDAFDRIAYPTVHGASPEARASVDSVAPQPTTRGESDRTDKAAPRPSEGTGDTPDSPKPIKGGVSDRSKPINGPDPDSRVWETPVHTPAPHATRGEGSEQRECTEPVAWAVMLADGERIYDVYTIEEEAKAIDEAVTGNHGIVPIYRSPTLTDAEREAVERAADWLDRWQQTHGYHSSESGDLATLRGLLERMEHRQT